MPTAERELLTHGAVRKRGADIETSNPIERVGDELTSGEHVDDGRLEEAVRVRRQHELSARSADSDILRDELEDGNHIGVGKTRVLLSGHLDEANREREPFRPVQHTRERWSPEGRVPLDHHEFEICPATSAYLEENVEEVLHASDEVAAVVRVLAHDDERNVGPRRRAVAPSPPQTARCHPATLGTMSMHVCREQRTYRCGLGSIVS